MVGVQSLCACCSPEGRTQVSWLAEEVRHLLTCKEQWASLQPLHSVTSEPIKRHSSQTLYHTGPLWV